MFQRLCCSWLATSFCQWKRMVWVVRAGSCSCDAAGVAGLQGPRGGGVAGGWRAGGRAFAGGADGGGGGGLVPGGGGGGGEGRTAMMAGEDGDWGVCGGFACWRVFGVSEGWRLVASAGGGGGGGGGRGLCRGVCCVSLIARLFLSTTTIDRGRQWVPLSKCVRPIDTIDGGGRPENTSDLRAI